MPHEFKMPQKYIDSMTARMGREHSQETFETEKTALVVVDMQNYFMHESQQAGCPVGQTIVGNVNRIADTVRRTGGISSGSRISRLPIRMKHGRRRMNGICRKKPISALPR